MELSSIIIAFLLVVILLLVLLLLDYYRYNNNAKSLLTEYKAKIVKTKEDAKLVLNSDSSYSNTNYKVMELESELIIANNKILVLENQVMLEMQKTRSNLFESINESILKSQNSDQFPGTSKKNNVNYARYADLGDGFSISELLVTENDETIFEIIMKGTNSASFKVSNNRNAQKYALTNASYFFNKVCKYESSPTYDSIITTDTDGVLKLEGNKWIILSPAKISFN